MRDKSLLEALAKDSIERIRVGVADVSDADLLEEVLGLAERAGPEGEDQREDRD